MAVQQLAKDQAKREKKNQKDLDKKFKEDEENALKDTQRMIDLMEKIYKQPEQQDRPTPFGLPPRERGPGGPMLEAKAGKLVKCGAQIKGTSPLIRKRKGKK
tara:strand:+ start:186 stop:491 length:306 start_codon:yes stop_codon:yes gene_type:complete